MRTAQQKITKLQEVVNFGVKFCRVLLILFLVSLAVNIVLSVKLYKANVELSKPDPVIMTNGTIEKVGENLFEVIPDNQLPELPEHLK